jgi:hypothetical protein
MAPKKRIPLTRTLAAVSITAALVVPALAQDTWYIVKDMKTKRCSVVKERPTTKTTVVVSGRVYNTDMEAETALRTVKIC